MINIFKRLFQPNDALLINPENQVVGMQASNNSNPTYFPKCVLDSSGNVSSLTGPNSDSIALKAAFVAPAAFTSRALTNADNLEALICATAQTATVNTGLTAGFGCSFKGAIGFAGTATVTDVRTTGATNPWCALVNTGTDTYDCVGGKA